ncbi:hypothetical protein ILUMI_16465 [Ignelater luminosus]|uniref:Uncharacterized protein n=1 Tax=Ignelater luminosus TaxID=2038154 RepID=A0A8K0G8X5_IGNLU|nr:hypothetical protein ILUMI_16465 [Ignelater luminosus]
MGFNKIQLAECFKNLKKVLMKCQFSPHRIYNMDESGFQTVLNKLPKHITPKRKKEAAKKVSSEQGINALGHYDLYALVVFGNEPPQQAPTGVALKRQGLSLQMRTHLTIPILTLLQTEDLNLGLYVGGKESGKGKEVKKQKPRKHDNSLTTKSESHYSLQDSSSGLSELRSEEERDDENTRELRSGEFAVITVFYNSDRSGDFRHFVGQLSCSKAKDEYMEHFKKSIKNNALLKNN